MVSSSLGLPPEFGGPPEFTTTARASFDALRIGGNVVDWISSALALIGDVVDPFLPGFAGSELRPTSRTVNLAAINAQRRAAGLAPLGGRRRRKRALTNGDRADIAFVAGVLGKPAGRDFANIIAART